MIRITRDDLVFFRCVLKSNINDEIKIRTLNALTKNGTKILAFQVHHADHMTVETDEVE